MLSMIYFLLHSFEAHYIFLQISLVQFGKIFKQFLQDFDAILKDFEAILQDFEEILQVNFSKKFLSDCLARLLNLKPTIIAKLFIYFWQKKFRGFPLMTNDCLSHQIVS